MQNFRPPVMDEVDKKQNKTKRSLKIIIAISILTIGFGGFIIYQKIKSHRTLPTIQDQYNTLIEYYNALVVNDTHILNKIAPTIQHELDPMINTERRYSLYIFDSDSQTNKNALTFEIIDHHINEEKFYINQAIFSETSKNIILEIKYLNSGTKIN
ncbi:MAG: hypothetical protein ACRCVW_06990 [Brevinema sp.]